MKLHKFAKIPNVKKLVLGAITKNFEKFQSATNRLPNISDKTVPEHQLKVPEISIKINTGEFFISHTHQIAFITSHDQSYAICKEFSIQTYLDWGIGNIVYSRLIGILTSIIEIFRSFGREFILILIIGFFYIV